MPYWKLYYPIVTATKNRLPLLSAKIEPVIYGIMENKIKGLGGILYAINGIEDHVHLVVSVPPKIAVSELIGQVKATAATIHIKTYPGNDPFFWQREYSVFSFDEKRIGRVIEYVGQQKTHHAGTTTIPALEWLEPGE